MRPVWTIRPYGAADHQAVTQLADRLLIGMPRWRDRDRWLAAVRQWVSQSTQEAGEATSGLLVVTENERVAGFVSLSTRSHFTGDIDAYIGELVVAEWAEGRGAGCALLQAAEEWAMVNGHQRVTLETGAANDRARRFYARAGYLDEDVRLTKSLPARR